MSGEVDWKTCKVVRHDGYQVSQISRVCVRHENIDDADSSPAAHAKPSIMQDSKFDVAGRLRLSPQVTLTLAGTMTPLPRLANFACHGVNCYCAPMVRGLPA